MADLEIIEWDQWIREDGEIVVKTVVRVKMSPPERRRFESKILTAFYPNDIQSVLDAPDGLVEEVRFDRDDWMRARSVRIAEGIAERAVERGLWTREEAEEFMEAVMEKVHAENT